MPGGLTRKRSFNLLPGGLSGSLTLSVRLDLNSPPGRERVTSSPVDESPTREPPVCTPKRTRISIPLGPPTTPPDVTTEYPTTTPSPVPVLVQQPGGFSKVGSTPLIQPDSEPPTAAATFSSTLDVIPASLTPLDSGPPSTNLAQKLSSSPLAPVEPLLGVSHLPESLSRADIGHAADGALAVRQSDSIEWHEHDGRQLATEISSLSEQEVFCAPFIFPVHTARTPKKKTRTPHISNASTTIATQNSEELRPVGVVALPSSSRAMENQYTNTLESVQSPPAPLLERPTIPAPQPPPIRATSNDFWNAPPVDAPLPPSSEVGCPMPVPTMHSNHSPIGEDKAFLPRATLGYDTGAETSHQDTPIHLSKGPAQFGTVSSPKNEGSMGSVPMAQWQEFLLPDGSCYFLNRILNIVTDFDLRDAESLQAVTKYLHGRHTEIPPPPEWGLWLYNASGPNTAFIPLIAWVNHGARKVVFGSPTSLELGGFICKDIDRLDSEHQYWSFMASHPVHALLPPGSITEAIDLLTWFYTSRLLPSPRRHPLLPFSQEECQELGTQLRFFSHMSTQTMSLVRTRAVSTVHVRVVAWRQGRLWDGGTYQGPQRKNNNLPLVGSAISLLCITGKFIYSFLGSGLPIHIPWNDHVIKGSLRVMPLLLVVAVVIGALIVAWNLQNT